MKKFESVLTTLDRKYSPYSQYVKSGNGIGRVMHYIYHICGLRYAESCIFGSDGIVYYPDEKTLFAKVDWSKGYPDIMFTDARFSARQKELLEKDETYMRSLYGYE
jgi:hypothetical protein